MGAQKMRLVDPLFHTHALSLVLPKAHLPKFSRGSNNESFPWVSEHLISDSEIPFHLASYQPGGGMGGDGRGGTKGEGYMCTMADLC